MEAIAAIVLIVVVVLVLLGLTIFRFGLSLFQTGKPEEPGADPEGALRYPIPTGQDPAVVMTALRRAGFTAEPRLHKNDDAIVIMRADGQPPDREEVRSVLVGARNTDVDGSLNVPQEAVTFADESRGR